MPLHAAALLTAEKSFCDNRVIGSPALNRRGLHVGRVALAERMADRRRRRLGRFADPADREAFARDGFVVRRDALPPDLFAALREEIETRTFEAREMRQGAAVTRFVDLPPAVLARNPALAATARGPLFQGLLRYVAATDADPILYLHTVITHPDRGAPDPQTAFHSDTFHPTAKGWLFLRDVEEADGPFTYVPGSHRLTAGRRAWEQAQSETAATAPNRLHARGSFRATAEEIAAMGFGEPVSFAVPANTLVVADTHGFHARGPSLRPSVRVALYGSLRRNPFLPWTGLDPLSLPGLAGRKGAAFGAWLDARERWLGKKSPQPRVGAVLAGDPTPRV
ncbi:MAG: phytanoyl-CoA dioxygenase [Rhodobacteraceae bacterium]|nr:MAG: phytanoyl-CoA dioxygenase [Paracoccaceae bacterium]